MNVGVQVKKKVLRLLNSGTTLFVLLAVSGVTAVCALFLSPPVSTYFYAVAMLMGTAALMVLGHKIRRLAEVAREIKVELSAQRTKLPTNRNVVAPATTKAAEPDRSLVKSVTGELREEISRLKEDQHRSNQSILRGLTSTAYSAKSQVHPDVSAGAAQALSRLVDRKQPETISVFGGPVTGRLASWMISGVGYPVETSVAQSGTAQIELALFEVLLIDVTSSSTFNSEKHRIVGKLLPTSEIWIIGNYDQRVRIVESMVEADSDLLEELTSNENRELTIMRKFGK